MLECTIKPYNVKEKLVYRYKREKGMYLSSYPNQKNSFWITMLHPQSMQLVFEDVPQSVLLCNMTLELRYIVFQRFPGIPVPCDGGWEWSPLQSKIFRTWSVKLG